MTAVLHLGSPWKCFGKAIFHLYVYKSNPKVHLH